MGDSMSHDREERSRQKAFSRRAFVLGAGQFAAFGALGARLYYLQVEHADRYALLADENRIKYRLVPPLRGSIVDRFGQTLASNRENLQVIVVPEDTDDLAGTLAALGEVAPLKQAEVDRILKVAARQRGFVPITVMENIGWQEFARINVDGPNLPGVLPQMGATRQYHYGKDLAHVIGYVAAANQQEVGEDPLLLMPGFRIGKNGVEKTYDVDLRGKAGSSKVEINAGGRVIRELDRSPSTPGAELVLSIDLDVQRYVMERTQGESAAVVAIDVRTGEILALASAPGFDPNDFVDGIDRERWRTLLEDQYKPLTNKALNGQYPPGSVFKMVVALAALENKIITPSDTVRCAGRYRLGSHYFHCWKRQGHGRMNLHNGIKQSCDIYFYDTARRVGIDAIAEMAGKLGLGQTLGFEVFGAKAGAVPSTAWKRSRFSEPWYPGETLVAGIGQGYVLATPLQLAVMTARLASGTAVEPKIVRAVGENNLVPDAYPALDISARALALVRDGMDAVVNEPGGTAGRSKIDVNGLTMAGKTGTSQVRRITQAERRTGVVRNENLPWAKRDHALFVCFAPVTAPRYAIAVIVEHGGGGSRAAAPIAKDIMAHLLERDPAVRPAYGPANATRAADAETPNPVAETKEDRG
jgi:penicillin-binding protein 2